MPRLQLREKPWPPGKKRTCPVCKKPWWPWAGSYLPCHSKCLFTEQEQADIKAHTGTIQQIAAEYGVTVSVIISVTRKRGTQ